MTKKVESKSNITDRKPQEIKEIAIEENNVSLDVYSLALQQIYQSFPPSIASSEKMKDGALSMFTGIAPRTEIETMLAAQMIACHNLSMEAVLRASRPEQSLKGQVEHANQANKLMRTFALQTEALSKLRGDSKTVTVKHVTVAEGGQAIIGDVHHGNTNEKK